MQNPLPFALLAAALLAGSACKSMDRGASLQSDDGGGIGVTRYKFTSGPAYLEVELLRDDLAHFELSQVAGGPNPENGIYTTPMIAKTDWPGPTAAHQNGNTIETPALRLAVDPQTLCVQITDLARQQDIGKFCGEQLDQATKRLTLDPLGMTNAYGVGNFFYDPSTADGDWVGRDWYGVQQNGQRTDLGNVRMDFNGAAPSMSQFPVVYAAGPGMRSYAFFLDQAYRISWDFRDPHRWFAEMWGDQIRWFVMAGQSFKDERSRFLELTGRPLIPPKALFGLWVSEFGYESWDELHADLQSLRDNNFPIDGFGMDLQWFGAGFGDPAKFKMGALRFDDTGFPNAATEVRRLRDQEGVRLINIEESYVNQALPEYNQILQAGQGGECLFVRTNADDSTGQCTPSTFGSQSSPIWWGWGGMLDWTYPKTGSFWHQLKRHELAKMGITAHWCDLGEPEMYDANGYYHGYDGLPGKNRHGDVHNLYAFEWLQSIYQGYMQPQNQAELQAALGLADAPRFYSMSRAGAPGIQRFGAGMWSGDIGRNMGSLRAHTNTQMNMSMAGVDYYTSDAGGFTWALNDFYNDAKTDDQYKELYTQWFADSALADLPLRPHGWAYGAQKTSYAPTNKGYKDSNYANVRQKYELAPYLYTFAWRAYQNGEPLIPPLVYHFQDDPNARTIANEKMLGDSLLFGIVASYGETQRGMYLPKGTWIDYHTHLWVDSQGEQTQPWPEYLDRYGITGAFTLPLFARAGAIIPKAYVDKDTMNVYGKRRDGQTRPDLIARVYADTTQSDFTLYEDDGDSLAYMKGAVRTTHLTQQMSGSQVTVGFGAANGTYAGAPDSRAKVLELVVREAKGAGVSFDGQALAACASENDFWTGSTACWINSDRNLILARSRADMPVSDDSTFVVDTTPLPPAAAAFFTCDNGNTQDGEAIYVVGAGVSGSWDASSAIRLTPTRYPRWTGLVKGLAAGQALEWKCLKKADGATDGTFENGDNHVLQTPAAGGYAGVASGAF